MRQGDSEQIQFVNIPRQDSTSLARHCYRWQHDARKQRLLQASLAPGQQDETVFRGSGHYVGDLLGRQHFGSHLPSDGGSSFVASLRDIHLILHDVLFPVRED